MSWLEWPQAGVFNPLRLVLEQWQEVNILGHFFSSWEDFKAMYKIRVGIYSSVGELKNNKKYIYISPNIKQFKNIIEVMKCGLTAIYLTDTVCSVSIDVKQHRTWPVPRKLTCL